MNVYFSRERTASARVFVFAFILLLTNNLMAQSSRERSEANTGSAETPQASDADRPKSSTRTTATKPSLEKKFFVNILDDQRAIWTSPFHLQRTDSKWLAPLGFSTIALIVTDRRTSGELVEHGDNLNRLRISNDISRFGSYYATAGIAGAMYLTGRATHNDHLRETGLLGAEALIDSGLLVSALKTATQRQRPRVDNSSGEFFDGGSSFPSGHAVSSWSLATIVAQEYGHHRPLVQIGAYGLATAVSLSRYTGRKHFLSDVLVGSAMGYGIGRYVYHKRHNSELDALNESEHKDFAQSRWLPKITPLYYPRAHLYGGALAWNF